MNELNVLSSERVEQKTHENEWAILKKERILLTSSPHLGFVRKYPIDGANKPAVMLVHGFAQNRYSWHTSIRSMSAWLAAQGHDVWNLELRGHGWARKADQRAAFKLDDYVEDVQRAANAIPHPTYWIGHSMGGGAIYGAAAKSNGKNCLGLIGLGAVFYFGQGNPLMRHVCRLSRTLQKAFPLKNATIHTKGIGKVFNQLFPLLDIAGYLGPVSGWWPGSIERDLAEERIIKGFDRTAVAIWHAMSHLAKQPSFPYEEEWKNLKQLPIWVILGDEDHLLTEADGKPAFELSNSTRKKLTILNNIEHETHWGHLDIILGKLAPTYVWRPISEWMETEAQSL